jgi:hypothetical protein
MVASTLRYSAPPPFVFFMLVALIAASFFVGQFHVE